MAWDPNRRDLIFWGGGHANYAGNEVYRFRSSSRRWERASLPSAVVEVSDAQYEPVDGLSNAPIAAHTYDNSEFLPIADRFVTFGGAAYNTGRFFQDTTRTRRTGPFFWDPSAAHPNRVGGTDGSHSNRTMYPNVTGGQMWENRDNLQTGSLTAGQYPGDRFSGFINGGTAYTVENGKDVLYVCDFDLWKYTVHAPENAALDTYEKVGNDASGLASAQGPGAYDPDRRVFVKLYGGTRNFVIWDLSTPGPTNPARAVTPFNADGTFNSNDIGNLGVDYDPIRERFLLWGGNKQLWELIPPANVVSGTWILQAVSQPPGSGPTRALRFTGVLGKWKYIPQYDVFMGMTEPESGEVWAYKPESWQPVLDLESDLKAPVAAISSPPANSTSSGTTTVTATAMDDVGVAEVELFVDGTRVATDSSEPYVFDWNTTAFLDGLVSLTVRAHDDAGNEGLSREVVLRVDNDVPAPDVTPPEVMISSPTDGSIVSGLVPLSATASDDRALVSLSIAVDGSTQCSTTTDTVVSCNWDADSADAGTHSITATAEDGSGNVGTDTISVTVEESGNQAPQVRLTQPVSGAGFAQGLDVVLEAEASDLDGGVVEVAFFANGMRLGAVTAEPYNFTWSTPPNGNHTLTAVATDDLGAVTTSLPVTINVGRAVMVLQDGLDGYLGTSDTYLADYYPKLNFGGSDTLIGYSHVYFYEILLRFEIFASEGGPVPDGATIESAKLELYKYSFYDHQYRAHRLLQDWSEREATWNQRLPGVPWAQGGARGSGTDIAAVADGEGLVGWQPQWIAIDVTSGVQAMSDGEPNHGWKLIPIAGNPNVKKFHSRDTASEPSKRPRLIVSFTLH